MPATAATQAFGLSHCMAAPIAPMRRMGRTPSVII